jgi:hypothetical protein
MIRAACLALAMALAPAAHAAGGAVKVRSGWHGDFRPLEGTGLTFVRKHREKIRRYVVTSDHVVYHGNESGWGGYRHSILDGTGNERVARFLAADAGSGLALLEVLGPDASAWDLEVQPFPKVVETPLKGQSTMRFGYPYGSRTVLVSLKGFVESAESKYAFLPLGLPQIELLGDAGEYGMSGGPVLSVNYGLIGLLSHQIIVEAKDGDPRTIEWRMGNPIQNHLLLVPGRVVRDFVDEYFRDPEGYLPFYDADPGNQQSGRVLSTGSLTLDLWCSERPDGACTTSANLLSKPRGKYPFRWFAELEAILRADPALDRAVILGFRKPELAYWTTEQQHLRPRTSLEFFRLMARVDAGELVPLVRVYLRRESQLDVEKTHEPRLSSAMSALSRGLGDARAKGLGEAVRSMSYILWGGYDRYRGLSETFWTVKPSDLDALAAPRDPRLAAEWETMDPRERVRVRELLKAARDALAKLSG